MLTPEKSILASDRESKWPRELQKVVKLNHAKSKKKSVHNLFPFSRY